MKPSVLLRIVVPMLTALGTVILGLGQKEQAIPMVAVFASFTSAIFTDWLGWLVLSPLLANLAALIAVAYSFFKLSSGAWESQLVWIANLLIYLQIVMLYQQKHLRLYWYISMLSLLQVIVAAALDLGPQFGVLLIFYFVLALATIALLYVSKEAKRLEASGVRESRLPDSGGMAMQRSAPAIGVTIEHTNRTVSAASFAQRMVNGAMLYQLTWVAASTLCLAAIVFFLLPRFGDDYDGWNRPGAQRLIGFSSQIKLGEMGNALEDPRVAMRAQFTDEDGNPFRILMRPYFRGNVLSRYVPLRGTWLDAGRRFISRTKPLASVPSQSEFPIVEQTIVLESEGPAFSVFPAFRSTRADPGALRVDDYSMLLTDSEPIRVAKARRYQVATTAFRNGIQRKWTPASRVCTYPGRLAPLLQFAESELGALHTLATDIVENAHVDPNNPQAICKLLEAHFRRSADYSYTLHQDRPVPDGTDPIVHFVTETRSGNCEYFASALTLMLRSLKIPARVVVGFHGGEYNRMGHFFLVRQLHAHAWVEAYLSKEQLDDAGTVAEIDHRNGAWIRLDPTPAAAASHVADSNDGLFDNLAQLTGFLEVLWKDYVVGLNGTRQQEAIYRPIAERTAQSVRGILLNPAWWRAFATELRTGLALDSWTHFQQRWLTWKSVPLLAGLFFAGLLLRRIFHCIRPYLPRQILGWARSRKTSWANDPQLLWYKQLEQSLGRRGYRRARGQTHQEFLRAVCVNPSIREPRGSSQLADELSSHFYKVRFGKRKLSAAELQSLSRSARKLESVLFS